MKKIVKHSVWLAADVVALPAVAVLSAVTHDKKAVVAVADDLSKRAKKISEKINEKFDETEVVKES